MKKFTKMMIGLVFCSSLVTVPAFAANNNSNGFNTEQKAQIEDIVHQYLLKKPEVLIEVMQILQRKQFEQTQQTVKQTQKTAAQFAEPLFHQSDDPIAGNPNGKVTLVEFFDYQCPHCVDMAPVMTAILKANPDLRVIYKEFPIRGPMSELASRAALAANKQGKYVEFNHALLSSNTPLTKDSILVIAKNIGLNVDQLKKDMDNSAIESQLKTTRNLAQNLKLFGTPAFFIGKTNGKNVVINYIPGQMNEKQLQDEIDKASK